MGPHNGNRRGTLIELAAPVAFLAFLFIVQPASADTITFVDTTNTITVDHAGADQEVSVLPGSCSPTDETFQCQILITSFTGGTRSPATELNISEAGVDPTLAVSDTVFARRNTVNSYLVIFGSDRPGDPSSGGLGLTPGTGPSIPETGGVQTAFTLSWSDGKSDIIRFQSDLDPVPEPGTLVLFGSGLVSMLGFARRRIFRA